MVDVNKSEVVFLLDSSGSMNDCLADTLGGFKTFIEDQAKIPGECNFTLWTFANPNRIKKVIDSVPVALVAPLTDKSYRPNGGTALLDAIGTVINETGERLGKLPENKRPGKVVIGILTDGEENCSQTHTEEGVRSMIEHQESVYSWTVAFLSSDIKAVEFAKVNLGMHLNAVGAVGTADAYVNFSKSLSTYRGGSAVGTRDFFATDTTVEDLVPGLMDENAPTP